MNDRHLRCSRRKFLASAAALTLAGSAAGDTVADQQATVSRSRPGRPSLEGRKPIAVIATVYRPLSHAYHIVGRFLHGYTRGGQPHVPKQFVHTLFVDQTPDNDLSRELGREFGFRVCRSVAETLLEAGKR